MTHHGRFHADDVFSVALSKIIFGDISLNRTRCEHSIKNADIVIDVGEKYDPDNNLFDHHQKEGAGKRENGIPYSSFGLIWKKYGVYLCEGRIDVANRLDKNLVSPIDAVDCGHIDGEYFGLSLSQTISLFNPVNDETNCENKLFNQAVSFAVEIIKRSIKNSIAEVEAIEVLTKAIKDSNDPRYILLMKNIPWKHIINDISCDAIYVIHPSSTGQWRVQAIPQKKGSFSYRKPLPKKWAGMTDQKIKDITGVSDAIFCHNTLFTAGAKSLKGAIELANIAIRYKDSDRI